MRRIVLLLPVVLGALALPAGAAEPTADPRAAVPTLGARVEACETGPTSADRSADFTGSMPAAPGASVLAMRFALEQRRDGVWKRVPLQSFRTWHRSVPGAAGFVYDKRVQRLDAGATYRVRVLFRWTAADGTVVRRAERTSRACRQPDRRPDLALLGLTAEPAPDGRARYVARVRNEGPGTLARGADLRVTVAGVAQPVQRIGVLADGEVATVAVDGPPCLPGQTVRATADPDDDVEERDEDDNAFALRCA